MRWGRGASLARRRTRRGGGCCGDLRGVGERGKRTTLRARVFVAAYRPAGGDDSGRDARCHGRRGGTTTALPTAGCRPVAESGH